MAGKLKVISNSGDKKEICIQLEPEPEATTAVMNMLSSITFEKKSDQFIHEVTRTKSLSNKSNVASLPASIDMYRRLEDKIDVNNTSQILVMESFNKKYSPVVKDFCDKNNIDTNVKITNKRRNIVVTFLPSFLLGVAMQLFWAVYNMLRGVPAKAETAFFYGPARFDNFSPILNTAENSTEINHQFVSKAIKPSFFLPKHVRDHGPVSLGRFTKPVDLWSSLKLVFGYILPEILFKKSVENMISKQVSNGFDVHLPNTISLHYHNTYSSIDFWIFTKYISAKSAIEQMDCSNIIVDSMSGINRAISFAGRKHGANVYHTPDGIINENLWEPKCTHFVSGTSAQEYIKRKMGEEYAHTYISTGRPNLVNISVNNKNSDQELPGENTEFELLIATQPKDDVYRETFVKDIVCAAEESLETPSITIKIHPLENMNFYSEFESKENITVDDGDLFENIKRSHLVVCPSSNVGLESIIAGTPSIS